MNQISNFFTKHQEIIYKIRGYIIQKKQDKETISELEQDLQMLDTCADNLIVNCKSALMLADIDRRKKEAHTEFEKFKAQCEKNNYSRGDETYKLVNIFSKNN